MSGNLPNELDELRGYIIGSFLTVGYFVDNGRDYDSNEVREAMERGILAARLYARRTNMPYMGDGGFTDADNAPTP